MKLLPALGLTVAAVFVLSKLSTASAASRVNFIISGVSLDNIGITPVLKIILQAQNPTSEEFLINAITANIALNDQPIGNVSGPTTDGQTYVAVSVKPLSSTPVPVLAMIAVGGLVSDITDILTGAAGLHAVFHIQGTANIENLLVPLDIKYTAL